MGSAQAWLNATLIKAMKTRATGMNPSVRTERNCVGLNVCNDRNCLMIGVMM